MNMIKGIEPKWQNMLINIFCGVLQQSSSPFIIADEVRWVGNWGAKKRMPLRSPHAIESAREFNVIELY